MRAWWARRGSKISCKAFLLGNPFFADDADADSMLSPNRNPILRVFIILILYIMFQKPKIVKIQGVPKKCVTRETRDVWVKGSRGTRITPPRINFQSLKS